MVSFEKETCVVATVIGLIHLLLLMVLSLKYGIGKK